jgi:hypothetical protein
MVGAPSSIPRVIPWIWLAPTVLWPWSTRVLSTTGR